MKKPLIILSLLFTTSVFAQKADLTVIDPHMDASSLKDNYKVHSGELPESSLPNLNQRDSLFYGLKEVQNWDELKKDIFYMDLRSKPLDYLKNKYPELKQNQLQTLKNKI